jgi:hypothetical protein
MRQRCNLYSLVGHDLSLLRSALPQDLLQRNLRQCSCPIPLKQQLGRRCLEKRGYPVTEWSHNGSPGSDFSYEGTQPLICSYRQQRSGAWRDGRFARLHPRTRPRSSVSAHLRRGRCYFMEGTSARRRRSFARFEAASSIPLRAFPLIHAQPNESSAHSSEVHLVRACPRFRQRSTANRNPYRNLAPPPLCNPIITGNLPKESG